MFFCLSTHFIIFFKLFFQALFSGYPAAVFLLSCPLRLLPSQAAVSQRRNLYYHLFPYLSTPFFIFFTFFCYCLIANLNSTPLWDLILQIFLPAIMEFNLSELSVKIISIKYDCFLPAGRTYL